MRGVTERWYQCGEWEYCPGPNPQEAPKMDASELSEAQKDAIVAAAVEIAKKPMIDIRGKDGTLTVEVTGLPALIAAVRAADDARNGGAK